MITFYRHKDCKDCDLLSEKFKDLAIAYKAAQTNETAKVTDYDEFFSGHKAIAVYLDEMAEYVQDWLKYQSDVCYRD